MLQSNQVLEKIKKGLVKKVLTKLKAINKKTPEKYDSFYENYGKFLKE
jgi:molecular chaperone HtpG